MICICGIRMVRGSFTDVSFHYVIVAFAALFFQYDFKDRSETFLVDFFFAALIIRKVPGIPVTVAYDDMAPML